MRSPLVFAFLAILISAAASAQTLADHAAAAAGATIGTAAGKPISNSLTTIFGNVGEVTAAAAGSSAATKNTAKPPATTDPKADAKPLVPFEGGTSAEPNAGGTAPASTAAPLRAVRPSSRQRPAVARALPVSAFPTIIQPPVKEPTVPELLAIQIGTARKDLETALGTPESHVTVPGDEGHLLESYQYWAHGRQLALVHLDNGQVVKIDIRVH